MDEMTTLLSFNTKDLVDLNREATIVGWNWAFMLKLLHDGSTVRHKAHLLLKVILKYMVQITLRHLLLFHISNLLEFYYVWL